MNSNESTGFTGFGEYTLQGKTPASRKPYDDNFGKELASPGTESTSTSSFESTVQSPMMQIQWDLMDHSEVLNSLDLDRMCLNQVLRDSNRQ